MKAKLLLLRNLVFWLPVRAASTTSMSLCFEFDVLCKDEFLRKPDEEDLKSILQLHKHVHKIPCKLSSLNS